MTEIVHEPVEIPPRRTLGRGADNPLVRAIGRLRLPLGAKLLGGFALIAALLAIAIVLGLIALGDSNYRGKQLLSLQKETAYEQLLLTDANHLAALLGNRASPSLKGFGLGNHSGSPPAAAQALLRLVDANISTAYTTLQRDFSQPTGLEAGSTSLRHSYPAFARIVQSSLDAFQRTLVQIELGDSEGRRVGTGQITRMETLMATVNSALSTLADRTTRRAGGLVTENGLAFGHSRDLLIEVGVGSLGLALLLGLLLSWSVVAPLRRTELRLAEIGAGDFSGRLEVVNRDEIGSLAMRVNRMSDELRRVYGELELASAHKSQFLANMSHELRTPLNAIIGFSEVLHEQMFGELNERQLAYVNDVLEAGRHLLSLINDVLDLAKIEAGYMELSLSEVAIPDVLRSAVSMHAERAERREVELALETEPEEITVTADERRVRQIVFNLVSNAVKFTPAEGRVDISAHLDAGHVEVAVTDTGPGIPIEDQETIFEEFEQTDEGRKEEGTGLGLPLSRKLVELHGGRLWVESQVGAGSTFRFTLPVHQEVS